MLVPDALRFFQWVEFAFTYTKDGKPKVAREKSLITIDDLPSLVQKHNNTGVYYSVMRYDNPDLSTARRWGPLYMDFDSDDLEVAAKDTRHTIEKLLDIGLTKDDIVLFFSGKKGFHVTVEPVALGIDPDLMITDYFRKAVEELGAPDSLDMVCYDPRRMWRIPGSKHPDTGLFKRRIGLDSLLDIAEILRLAGTKPTKPKHRDVAPRPKAIAWFQEIVDKVDGELRLRKTQLYYASKAEGPVGIANREYFTPKNLFEECKAFNQLVKKAEKTKELNHNERLFLMSLLSYSKESVSYLHQILSMCTDYNPETTQRYVDDWIKRRDREVGGRPFTCNKAQQLGVCPGGREFVLLPKIDTSTGQEVQLEEYSEPSCVRFAYGKRNKDE